MMSSSAFKYLLIVALLIILVGSFTVFQNLEPIRDFYLFLRHDIHPGLFILLMAVVPVLGVPLSPFLVLSGIKFGIPLGTALSLLVMPIHLSICYLLSHTFMHRVLQRILQARGYASPAFLTNRPGRLALAFLLMPGPPYILKNYLLALTGLRFLSYVGLTWTVQGLLALPVVILGGAASQHHWGLFSLVLALLILGSTAMNWYKSKYMK